MTDDFRLASSEIGAISQPPCEPPIEILEAGREWLVREFKIKQDDVTVYSSHSSRIDAMRAGQERMDEHRHPCLLRWDTPDSVGDIYWNELFECLRVERSDLLDGWVVVPGDDFFVFQCADDVEHAFRYARAVQRQYDFKHLEVRAEDGTVEKSVDHRFLRHSITDSGVRFDRGRPLRTGTAAGNGTGTDAEDDRNTGTVTPPSTLMAAVPDFMELEQVDSTGPIHTYRGPWTEDRPALIVLLDPDHTGVGAAVEEFKSVVEDWKWLAGNQRITTVFDAGKDSDAWIAYQEGHASAGEIAADLSMRSRLQVVADVAAALDVAAREGVTRTAVRPAAVRIVSQTEPARASLAEWGLRRAVLTTLDRRVVTPYTAPEELDGERTETTPVYQLGAFAYRLLCERTPFSEMDEPEPAIRAGALSDPSTVADVPEALDSILRRAMSTDPADRFESATDLSSRLSSAVR
jgi:hypothetical protein